jgi:hypothetical protein
MNKGLSGCKIELIDEDTLRKSSTDNRLFNQMIKQKNFADLNFTYIKTPRIKDYSWDNLNIFHFDMEYIPSSSFKDFFSEASKSELDNFYFCLNQYLNSIVPNGNIDFTPEILNKLTSLYLSSDYKKFIDYLIQKLYNQKIFLPESICHGDLTLSNILFKKGDYYFIDFLDCHINTYYYDLSKLKQDLYYKWSLKVENNTNLKVRQGIDYIWKLVYNEYKETYDSYEFQFVDALTLLRIEPYIKDTKTKLILKTCIEKLNLYEKFITTTSR